MTLALNHISHIPDHAFSKLGRLVVLDLNSNRLVQFPAPVRSLPNLRELGFHSNNIRSIPERAFIGNPSLVTVVVPSSPVSPVQQEEEEVHPGRGRQRQTLLGPIRPWSPDQRVLGLFRVTCFLRFPAADQDWEDLLMDFEDEAKVLAPVQCSPAPGPLHPCHHLLGSWVIRGGVWLIAVVALGSNSLVVLSVFCPRGTPTPARLLVGLLAGVNGLMGVWSGLLAAVDAWTYGSFWRYGTRWESGFLCRFSGFLCVFAAQAGLFLLTGAAVERYLSAAAQQRKSAGQDGRGAAAALCASGCCSELPAGPGAGAAPPAGRRQQHFPLPPAAFLLLSGLHRLPGAPRLAVFLHHDARLHSPLLSGEQGSAPLRRGSGVDSPRGLAALLGLPPLPPRCLPVLLLAAASQRCGARDGEGRPAAGDAAARLRQPAALHPVQPAGSPGAGGSGQAHLQACEWRKSWGRVKGRGFHL
ncbi:hypothetical protein fugu_020079 [Takifugu bimaculatus]|uniref:G-protein coupled receptors family 1 profile domain-containing protein n=1 Tax=Takifugu bimaculatus TaxID=433685 RepID=A0A4Z2BI89_9TELE|nr:hypothetical protein fugu_020079 [Takifugu bimaculatus]